MPRTRIVDVTDTAGFGLVPPCADPGFDHRSCDYWEDAERGSRAARASWLTTSSGGAGPSARPKPRNLFAPDPLPFGVDNPFAGDDVINGNPFLPGPRRVPANPFALDLDDDDVAENPFAPKKVVAGSVEGPRKLALLTRGRGVFGSYAKVLLVEEEGEERAVAYAQFGPLSAYPRALRVRDLYPSLPQAPLPAAITCIATTAEARGLGYAQELVRAVCEDLAARGFAAVEAYPEATTRLDATSAATPAFWEKAGFEIVIRDERFPVARREL